MSTLSTLETRELAKPAQGRLKIVFWLDITLMVTVCVLQTVTFTGLFLHEWLGLAIIGMVLAHLLFSWSWIASQTRRLFRAQSIRSRVNYLLNLGLFATVTAVIFSGILISREAIPALTGTRPSAEMEWRWDVLHNRFSEWVLMLAGLHLALNWEWVLAAAGKISTRVRKGAL